MVTVNPSFVWPVRPEVTTASDGVLSALLDRQWAGVHLKANFAGEPEQIVATNYVTNPGMRATSGEVVVAENQCSNPEPATGVGWQGPGASIAPAPWDASRTAYQATTASGTPYIFSAVSPLAYSAGDSVTVSATVQAPVGYKLSFTARTATGNYYHGGLQYNVTATGAEQRLTWTGLLGVDSAANTLTVALVVHDENNAIPPAGVQFYMGDAMIGAGPYYDGDTPADDTFTYRWTGTAGASTSQKVGQKVAGFNPAVSYGVASKHWSQSGDQSMRHIADYPTVGSSYIDLATNTGGAITLVRGKTYTVLATVHVEEARSNPPSIQFNATGYSPATVSTAAPNAPGTYDLRLTFTAPTDSAATSWRVRLYNAAKAGEPDVWWDDVLVTEGTYNGPYFDGSKADDADFAYRFTGAIDASTSEEFIPAVPPFDPMPKKAYFVRAWDNQTVRGADPAWVVGGIASAYEHEAALGSISSWFVVPELEDGTLLPPTAVVPKSIPDPGGGASDPSTWIKSLESPSSSVHVMIDSWPQFDYNTDAEATRIEGRKNKFVAFDVLSGVETTGSFRTMSRQDADAFMRLVEKGGTLLFQTATKYYRPSFYAVVSSVSRVDQAHYWQDQITWTVELTEVDRPGTKGSLPSTPGYTFAERYSTYPKFSDIPVRTFGDSRPF